MSELIDRQALRAAHGLGSDCHDCKRDMKSCQYDRDYSLMDFCEWLDDAPTASPWHRVEDEPRKERREYLIYTDTGYMCSCRWTNNVYGLGESDRWGWCLADIPQFQEVIYWMPIEPPKEEE